MADPLNRNDPTYANDSRYVWSGGRWQYRGDGAVDPNKPAEGGSVKANTTWDEGLFMSPSRFAVSSMKAAGLNTDLSNFADYATRSPDLRVQAFRQPGVNPYNAQVADQTRAAQLALMDQMRQQQGSSLAALQGQQALSRSGQQAFGLAAGGGSGGRAAMLGAQQAGAGLASDVGQARLAEMMRSQAGIGSAAGSLRGADQRSAEAQVQSGLRAQELEDQRARFYAQLGFSLDQARAQAASDNERLRARQAAWQRGQQVGIGMQAAGAGAQAVASAVGSQNG